MPHIHIGQINYCTHNSGLPGKAHFLYEYMYMYIKTMDQWIRVFFRGENGSIETSYKSIFHWTYASDLLKKDFPCTYFWRHYRISHIDNTLLHGSEDFDLNINQTMSRRGWMLYFEIKLWQRWRPLEIKHSVPIAVSTWHVLLLL